MTYRVRFDNEELIETCIEAIRKAPPIAKTKLQWRKADIAIGKAGVEATEHEGAATVTLEEGDIELPDLLTDLQDRPQLTRRTIHRVLRDCDRLDDRAQPLAIHRDGSCRGQPRKGARRRGWHQIPARRRRALLCPGAVPDGGADGVFEKHADRGAKIHLRAGGL